MEMGGALTVLCCDMSEDVHMMYSLVWEYMSLYGALEIWGELLLGVYIR